MKIAIAQINPVVGDLNNNCQKMLDFSLRAKELGAGLVVFPELSLTGYPPKDLLLRHDFLEAESLALDSFAGSCAIPSIIGAALQEDINRAPFNAAVFCHNGQWKIIGKKLLLPNYNVFDEKRYFDIPKAPACQVITVNNMRLLISICEDAWSQIPVDGLKKHDFDPIDNAIKRYGPVDVIINMAASPFSVSKPAIREKIFTNLSKTYHSAVLAVGQVGANDQLLFDGHSMAIDSTGQIVLRAKPCTEDLIVYDLKTPPVNAIVPQFDDDNLLMEVLTMGIRDYVEKCRMPGVIVGLSGGIDSAVCLALAASALGPKRVRAVFLPSQFSSEQSLIDAKQLAFNLSVSLETLPIEDAVNQLRALLATNLSLASTSQADIMDQNLQSRMRGLIIMALANLSDYLMVATSNKSELAVGYSTIYGDMCGAFSPIGDLYKTQVYRLANTINKQSSIIPQQIINRPPTAELKHNQLDSDSLLDYDTLDQILAIFIDQEKSINEIESTTNLSRSIIEGVIKQVSLSEYKRRQGPFCLMVSDKVFGDARRLPIAKALHT